MKKVVIIGAGHAGIQAAISLREEGFEGEIILLAAEKDMPYQKPPLSKGFLQGKQSESAIAFRSDQYYQNNRIELQLGVTVEKLFPSEHKLLIDTGDIISYTHLILATGASNRLLSNVANDTQVLYLRTLFDAKIIEKKLIHAQKIAIVGGGFIGLELAALAQEKCKQVMVIESQSRLMKRVLPQVISDVFEQTHQEKGVKIHLNTTIESIENYTINTIDGKNISADLILAGIGIIPECALALNAGIACNDGILVNEFQQTSIPNIYAIGDCANHFNKFAQKRMRLESIQNANDQAKTCINHIMNKPQPYCALPWFWTHQYHLKLQMAGISANFDTYEVTGDINSGKFSVYYYKNKKLIAVDSLNKPADHLNARKELNSLYNAVSSVL
jgi:3-phenylpropionate/trans-cinnamate dioxygenase ferredoxin reductase component